MPALVAPGFPMAIVATGTPGGICAVARSASSPFRADESIGTRMTGSVVCAATTPPRCAAAPAPTMKIFTPRAGASVTRRITRAGERCALATVISLEIPNSLNAAAAGCITGASESEPMSMRTSGMVHSLRPAGEREIRSSSHLLSSLASAKMVWLSSGEGLTADVSTILHAVERDLVHCRVCPVDGVLVRAPGTHDRQDAAAGCDDALVGKSGAGMK